MRNSKLHNDESGIAMLAVVMGFVVVSLLTFLVMSLSERQVEDAYATYREDRILSSVEAELRIRTPWYSPPFSWAATKRAMSEALR